LKEINIEEVPSDYKKFYNRYVNEKKTTLTNIKINNKILHQSKLLNYFKEDYTIKNINKDLESILKKIKKDRKYYFSTKDIILVEALKSDGIKVLEKYNNLYEVDDSAMPADIQVYINNNDMGLAMLRIVQVIGQDELKNIDPETMYFIISTLNQLDIDLLRNKILLKILPLKV
jgi:rRNA-processing protein FCF1